VVLRGAAAVWQIRWPGDHRRGGTAELTDRQFDIIVTDPPPPIELRGGGDLVARNYEAGRDHLTDGGS
jgi:hypothetical protein